MIRMRILLTEATCNPGRPGALSAVRRPKSVRSPAWSSLFVWETLGGLRALREAMAGTCGTSWEAW